jgi:hypothetical protein
MHWTKPPQPSSFWPAWQAGVPQHDWSSGLQPQTLGVTAPQLWYICVHPQLGVLWPHAVMTPHASPALPAGQTGLLQQAFW